MILPGPSPETTTDEELLAGYRALGFDEATAQAFVAVLRTDPDPAFPVD